MSSEIKIGSVNRSFTHRHPQKTNKHTESRLEETATFLRVGDDFFSTFSQRIYSLTVVLKDAQGHILSARTGDSVRILTMINTVRNFSYEIGETRLRNTCERIERNINGSESYTEDLHVLKQDISQVLQKITHLYK